MTFQQFVTDATAQGFTHISDGAETWELDNFASENVGDENDYTFDYNGVVGIYDENGYAQPNGYKLVK